MFEKMNEQVDVLVAFMKNKVLPLSFSWGKKKYSITKVNMVTESFEGRAKWYWFSVSCGEDYFKLGFDTSVNLWFMKEAVYV